MIFSFFLWGLTVWLPQVLVSVFTIEWTLLITFPSSSLQRSHNKDGDWDTARRYKPLHISHAWRLYPNSYCPKGFLHMKRLCWEEKSRPLEKMHWKNSCLAISDFLIFQEQEIAIKKQEFLSTNHSFGLTVDYFFLLKVSPEWLEFSFFKDR